ncbi:MAG: TlyA family RNA methyltransferase [Burkholderiales bacterium]|nr:TlyA family RNA methyltransferase [Phycisphaerae bacterium]
MRTFVSRGGLKLDHAVTSFGIDVGGKVCADLGCSTGGFTDCLLQHGAGKVYAVDTGYGVLDWKLRKDPRVVVMERQNAMHAILSEKVDLITIDCAWTMQKHILPAAAKLLKPGGRIVTLIKPHYEAEKHLLRKGILPQEQIEPVVTAVIRGIEADGFAVRGRVESPIKGNKGNTEVLALLEVMKQ